LLLGLMLIELFGWNHRQRWMTWWMQSNEVLSNFDFDTCLIPLFSISFHLSVTWLNPWFMICLWHGCVQIQHSC
jgi:hypothetical protein